MSKSQDYCVSFNNTALQLCEIIKKVSPNSLIGSNFGAIKSKIQNNPSEKYLLQFADKVLLNQEYVKNIKNGNVNFFIQKPHTEYASQTELSVTDIMDFTKVWDKLDSSTKVKVVKLIQNLLKNAEEYVKLALLKK